MVCDNPNVLTIDQVKKWYFPPREEEEKFFVGDGYEIELDDLMSCEDIEIVDFDDAFDMVENGEVKFITINNGKGFAIIKRNKPHLIEFEYSNRVIKNLLCDCIKPSFCDHSMAACIAADILTEKDIDRDTSEFSAIDVNEFLKIVSYTNKDISVKI